MNWHRMVKIFFPYFILSICLFVRFICLIFFHWFKHHCTTKMTTAMATIIISSSILCVGVQMPFKYKTYCTNICCLYALTHSLIHLLTHADTNIYFRLYMLWAFKYVGILEHMHIKYNKFRIVFNNNNNQNGTILYYVVHYCHAFGVCV